MKSRKPEAVPHYADNNALGIKHLREWKNSIDLADGDEAVRLGIGACHTCQIHLTSPDVSQP